MTQGASPIPDQPNLNEPIFSDWTWHKRLRRRLIAPLYRISDTGLFGLTPLRIHILICGYQRSGTTLLQAMLEHALPHARRFGKEFEGWRAATYSWRNHAVMISKVPNDLFQLHRVRNFYQGRQAKLRTILVIRDPRDVLTSKHSATRVGDYVQNPVEWRKFHTYFRLYCNDPDVLVVRYEQLVTDTSGTQARIEAFIGEKVERRFEDFHQELRDDFDTRHLNGVRPVDRSHVGRWALPEHRDRIEGLLLREIPDLCQILVELGYEPDESWVQRWQFDHAAKTVATAASSAAGFPNSASVSAQTDQHLEEAWRSGYCGLRHTSSPVSVRG